MSDLNEKLDSMIKLLENKFAEKYQQLEFSYQEKFREAKKKIEEEIKNYENQKMESIDKKAKNILDTAKSKAELKLRQEKAMRKNHLIEDILDLIKKQLANLDPQKKKIFYQKLFLNARNLMEEDFIVLCNEKDYDIVKSIVQDHKVEIDKNIEGGIILKGQHFSVNNTLSSYFDENKNEIVKLVLEEVGDI